tara:strand:+ start:139 stop:594 length:456 start_codon:yes stop_codon:yes gene_type:complete
MSILTDAIVVRDETQARANTATRVGGVLVDIATILEQLTDFVDVANNKVTANVVETPRLNIGNSDNYLRENAGDVELYGDASVVITSGDGVVVSISDVIEVTGNIEVDGLVAATGLKVTAVSEHVDNATAIAAGLNTGTHYRTGDLLKIVH